MDRRRFLLTSLAGVVVAPLRVGAQQEAKIARMGYLALNLAAGDLARPRGRSFPNTGRAPATDVAAPSHSRAGVSPSAPAMSSTSTEETPMSQWPSPCLGRTRALWAPVRPPVAQAVGTPSAVPGGPQNNGRGSGPAHHWLAHGQPRCGARAPAAPRWRRRRRRRSILDLLARVLGASIVAAG
jgi:hypothetical protein